MGKERLERVELLIGEDKVKLLETKTVLIAGVGGVGSYAAEALARTGIGKLILVDKDVVSVSNLNRQIMATRDTINISKCQAMKERIHSYNPDCEVICEEVFLDETNIDMVLKADFVIDAIDTVTSKIDLIEMCLKHHIPFISSLGMGNRLDPSCVEIRDLSKTEGDPLAKSVRSLVRKRNLNGKIPVLFSKEKPIVQNKEVNPEGETRKDRIPPASVVFVPAEAGLLAASYVVRSLIGGKENE